MCTDIDQVLRNELTAQQYSAVVDPAREVLCLACAGSGKSRTLAYRIARLLAGGATPESIVAFTFTEKAADTIKRRVAGSLRKVGISTNLIGAMYIGTIHGYCQYVLGQMDAVYRQYDILDENRLKLYLISRFGQLGLSRLYPRCGTRQYRYFHTIKHVSEAWNIINDEVIGIEQLCRADAELGGVLQTLRESLRQDQFIDFSLMIRNVVDALDSGDNGVHASLAGVRHIMVDEYQDVSPCQERLIVHLRALSASLFVVGDDDQSIYAWRGADVSNILSFERRYPNVSRHTLSDNFRSTSPIVQTSDAFVAAELGPTRFGKNPRAAVDRSPRDLGVLWFSARAEEAEWVADRILSLLGTAYEEADGTIRGLTPADFAILMRSTREPEVDHTARHAAYTQALVNRGIHYSLEAGGGPFERSQVAVMRSTFELLRDGSPTRETLRSHFGNEIVSAYPRADFDALATLLSTWGRLIHTPEGGARRRVYPQQLVYGLLEAFGFSQSAFPDEVIRDIGLFSRMIQDVEAVYMSVDSADRFRDILNFLNNAAETGYNVSTDDVLQRPDVVTVSTVHKAKGLEYPVVFVVDVEAQRFPGKRRRYEGWLPASIIQPAVNRGAYQKTREEEARLFYTAMTRAERYLYITGAASLPGGRRPRNTSEFARRLVHRELSTDPNGQPVGLTQYAARRRIDETILPTSFSDVRYYLRCPMDYRFRKGYGFSPPIPDMFGFGKTVHTAVEKLHEVCSVSLPTPEIAEGVARGTFHLKHVPQSADPLNRPGPYERARDSAVRIVTNYAGDYAEDFQRRRQVEVRFEIPATDCVISGAIDLLLKEDDAGQILEAEVIDFKAIEGGEDPQTNSNLDWKELCLQVQLYARAAREILGENARTGYVHLLKDSQRVNVPISDEAIQAAMANVEWAVQGILASDYPMRPHPEKCSQCDFPMLCPRAPEEFRSPIVPPPIHLPAGEERVAAFSLYHPAE